MPGALRGGCAGAVPVRPDVHPPKEAREQRGTPLCNAARTGDDIIVLVWYCIVVYCVASGTAFTHYLVYCSPE